MLSSILRNDPKKVYTKYWSTPPKKVYTFAQLYNDKQIDMNAKEFFYLVAEMRSAQQAYFETKDRKVFRAARALENEVDREIRRVREIVNANPNN